MSSLLQCCFSIYKVLTCLVILIITVDWAELVTIDLSKFDTPGGKEELVKELEYAVTKVGKFEASTTPRATGPLSAKKIPRVFLRKEL